LDCGDAAGRLRKRAREGSWGKEHALRGEGDQRKALALFDEYFALIAAAKIAVDPDVLYYR
jgi:hypothetical protein